MHLNEIRGFFLGSVLTLLLLVSIIVYAQQKWQAVWHGTDWIDSGETIRAREIAENFEYLLRKMNDLNQRVNNVASGQSFSDLYITNHVPIDWIDFPDIIVCTPNGSPNKVVYRLHNGYKLNGPDIYGNIGHVLYYGGFNYYMIYSVKPSDTSQTIIGKPAGSSNQWVYTDCTGKSLYQVIQEGKAYKLNNATQMQP